MKYKSNKLLAVTESLIYSSTQMFLGLFLHPYRSMQLLVKNGVLLPFIFYPTLIGIVFCLFLKIDLIFSAYQSLFLLKFIYQMIVFFCFYWQLALFYLWFRFSRAFFKL